MQHCRPVHRCSEMYHLWETNFIVCAEFSVTVFFWVVEKINSRLRAILHRVETQTQGAVEGIKIYIFRELMNKVPASLGYSNSILPSSTKSTACHNRDDQSKERIISGTQHF